MMSTLEGFKARASSSMAVPSSSSSNSITVPRLLRMIALRGASLSIKKTGGTNSNGDATGDDTVGLDATAVVTVSLGAAGVDAPVRVVAGVDATVLGRE